VAVVAVEPEAQKICGFLAAAAAVLRRRWGFRRRRQGFCGGGRVLWRRQGFRRRRQRFCGGGKVLSAAAEDHVGIDRGDDFYW
jgi:hypothetical protein